MNGNQTQQTMDFRDRVRCVYSPVPDWDTVVEPDDPDKLVEGAVLLTSDRLQVLRTPGATTGTTQPFELTATGNAKLDGRANAGGTSTPADPTKPKSRGQTYAASARAAELRGGQRPDDPRRGWPQLRLSGAAGTRGRSVRRAERRKVLVLAVAQSTAGARCARAAHSKPAKSIERRSAIRGSYEAARRPTKMRRAARSCFADPSIYRRKLKRLAAALAPAGSRYIPSL